MGLDMYLEAKNYLSKYDENDQVVSDAIAQAASTGDFRVKSVVLELGYWRKANHIHKWFVDNVQDGEDDCKDYYVSREQLEELRDLCKRVLENPEAAKTLLPTKDGFFFGGTEYDEYYLEDVKETIEIINKALKLPAQDWSIYYTSSW